MFRLRFFFILHWKIGWDTTSDVVEVMEVRFSKWFLSGKQKGVLNIFLLGGKRKVHRKKSKKNNKC